MKVLVVGGGGREHALCWALRASPAVSEVFCAPGNPGIAQVADCLPVSSGDIVELADLAEKLALDLTVVGPELPLSLGIADEFAKRELPIFGPTRLASQIEASKVFSKEFCRRHGIKTAPATVCGSRGEAEEAIRRAGFPVVLKADGPAAGKGVLTLQTREDADQALSLFFEQREFGVAGDRILVEEFLEGTEASFLAICDGETAVPLPTARDYKKARDGDRGPIPVGWARIRPRAIWTRPAAPGSSRRSFIRPSGGWRRRGGLSGAFSTPGLMLTKSGPHVLEFNARFGDPETEVILPRLHSDLAKLLKAAAQGELEGTASPGSQAGGVRRRGSLLGGLSGPAFDGKDDLRM